MKKFFLVVIAAFAFAYTIKAQEAEMPKYQRSSLHMVLLTTDEPALEGTKDFTKMLDQSWQNYPFPDKYNEHAISFTQAYGGQPKTGMRAIMAQYRNGFNGLGLADAKSLLESMKSSSAYEQELVQTIESINEKEKIGNQLIKKWFNIQEDGS